jgi:hypothetical protein
MGLLPNAEQTDCWQLIGVDDAATPPTLSRVLNAVGTRTEWRRAGLPVLFDEAGEPRPVVRGGREYRFLCVDPVLAAREKHPTPPA